MRAFWELIFLIFCFENHEKTGCKNKKYKGGAIYQRDRLKLNWSFFLMIRHLYNCKKCFFDTFQWISCPESKDFTIFHCSFNENGPNFERPENVEFLKIISKHLFHTWEGWGRVWGCQPRHKWVWGGCITLFSENGFKMPLVKRFSFVVFMASWVNTF